MLVGLWLSTLPTKTKPHIFSIMLVRTYDFCLNLEDIREFPQDTTTVAFPPKPDVITTSCRTETATTGPFHCCCSHQSLALPSICCSLSGLTVGTVSTFCDEFMVRCVEIMHFDMLLLLFCLSPKCNLSKKVLPGMGITQVRWKT